MPEGSTITLILILVFLGISAFFSSSEAAFLSLRKSRITHLSKIGIPKARLIENMTRQPERLLVTILLGNNLVNVAFTAMATILIVSVLGEKQGVAVATVLATAALLLVGEIVPKTAGVHHAERIMFLYVRILKAIEFLLLPIVIILQWASRRATGPLGGSNVIDINVSEGELRTLIDMGEAEGTFDPAEAEMLEKVFRFGDRQARDVMTPRTEIIFIDQSSTFRDFLNTYAQHAFTRFPVCGDSIDNIIGIVSAKDVLKRLARGDDHDSPVSHIVRDSYFVPETKRIAELFDELRLSGNQMAISIDEHGGLAGLVTLKSLSAVVVGPVGEEGKGLEEEYETIDKNTFQVEGSMSVDEANDELGLVIEAGDFETVAGYVLDTCGRIPNVGEQFKHKGLIIKVTEMDGLKIKTVKIIKLDEDSAKRKADSDLQR